MNEEPTRAEHGTHVPAEPAQRSGFPLARLQRHSLRAPLPPGIEDPLEAELLEAELLAAGQYRAPLSRGHLARIQVLRSNALRAREFGRMTIELYTIQVLLLGFLALATWVTGYYFLSRGDAPAPKPFVGASPYGSTKD